MISDSLLKSFKERMHIFHKAEDAHLKHLLNSSYVSIKNLCGDFDINKSLVGRELVFERARYAYNDQLEFFEQNFQSMIFDFGMQNIILGRENDE